MALLFVRGIRLLAMMAAVFVIIPLPVVRVWCQTQGNSGAYPIVVSTWPFLEAVRAAWAPVERGSSAVDAVVDGCSACEELRCDGTVGPGGSPDENGETTMDALIMNGTTLEVGAVAAMRYVKDGIRAARLVLEHTRHTLLVGEQASIFAISMGLPGPSDLSSSDSIMIWNKWKKSSCQPNFRKNVVPVNGCGPYHPMDLESIIISESSAGAIEEMYFANGVLGTSAANAIISRNNHDTISMGVIDQFGGIAVGTSTNGATFKIPGSYQVVESMRQGMEPKEAATNAISRIARKYPGFIGAVFAISKFGVHAAACHGWRFQYSVRTAGMEDVEVFTVVPSTATAGGSAIG